MRNIKVITLNVNGIRASARKGLFTWLVDQNPDYVCLQEVRAQLKDLSSFFFEIPVIDSSLKATYYFSKKPGYSGVGIFSKKKPTQFFSGIGVNEFDDEGRVLRLDFDNQYELFPLMSTVSVYFPSGSASESRQESKNRFLLSFMKVLKKWEIEYRETGRQFLLCGDWNIAHNEIDLKNWKQNKNNSGFLPWERKWLSQVFESVWVDNLREFLPKDEIYTWWSQRGSARENNVGWRIDYQVATKELAARVTDIQVFKEPKLSDHAPLIISYGL